MGNPWTPLDGQPEPRLTQVVLLPLCDLEGRVNDKFSKSYFIRGGESGEGERKYIYTFGVLVICGHVRSSFVFYVGDDFSSPCRLQLKALLFLCYHNDILLLIRVLYWYYFHVVYLLVFYHLYISYIEIEAC